MRVQVAPVSSLRKNPTVVPIFPQMNAAGWVEPGLALPKSIPIGGGDGGELGEGGSEVGAAIEAAVFGAGPDVAVVARNGAESGESGIYGRWR